MNKTKIEWTDYSWNPVTGCLHNCWFCYAKKLFIRFHKSFEPTFYPERLNELAKVKKPSKIFVCSVADLFASWTNPLWINLVINKIELYPQHIFQLLTKSPEGIDKNYIFGSHIWIGVTINYANEKRKIEELRKVRCETKFLSFEPLLEDIGELNLDGISWIIIGKLTGSRKVRLQYDWVENIIKQARVKNIPIFIKNNIKWKEKIQEFPK